MRIIAGQFRSIALAPVGKGDKGAHLRPTTDRVRESLFNVLSHRVDFEGARVLDLFAGTGALGLEALSRGADHATFVDDGRAAQRLIGLNITKLRVAERTDLMRCDARHLPECPGVPYAIVFIDPPYGKDLGTQALLAAHVGGWLAEEACIVWEESHPVEAPAGFAVFDRRKYGDTHVTLLSN